MCTCFASVERVGGGGRLDPPAVWPLIVLERRGKNQRVARHETKPMVPDFKVLGQPVTSEVRSNVQNRPNCVFADKVTCNQDRAAI